jgi:NitT/TauT family transport system substrate-binding protein
MIAMAALVLALAAACGASAPQRIRAAPTPDMTPVTVKLGHVASTEWAPLYVALDRGYFTKLNVNVQLQSVPIGLDPVQLVTRGQVDAVMTDLDATVFNGLGAGAGYRVVGSMAAIPADGGKPISLEVDKRLADSGQVKTLADLRGRKIAIEGGAGSGAGHLVDLMLHQAGVSLRDMTVIDLASTDMETAFQIKSIDAALSPAPYSSAMEQDRVAVPMATPPAGSTWSGVVYGPKLTGSPAQRLFLALVQGARDLVGAGRTSDATLAILSHYTGRSVDDLRKMPPFTWDQALRPDTNALAGLQTTYRDAGLLKYSADLPASRIVNGTYAKYAASAVH